MNITDIRFRVSNNGVPHIIIDADGQTYSACWFNKSKRWKLWSDYHGANVKTFSEEFSAGQQLSFEFMVSNPNR